MTVFAFYPVITCVFFFSIAFVEETAFPLLSLLVSGIFMACFLETTLFCSERAFTFPVLVEVAIFVGFVVEAVFLFELILVVDLMETCRFVTFLVALLFSEVFTLFTFGGRVEAPVVTSYVVMPLFMTNSILVEPIVLVFVELLEDSLLEGVKSIVPWNG